MIEHAWKLLRSGRRLDLLHPHPCAWTDEDLAIRLARTHRWGGDSRWDRPLSVAQHSLTVRQLREARLTRPLTPMESLREILHDAEEGLLNHDALTPIKPLLGEGYRKVVAGLRSAINTRYDVRPDGPFARKLSWDADRVAAASEARHVVGWSDDDIRLVLNIAQAPVADDPLPLQAGLQPWEPWPADLAAEVFLEHLTRFQRQAADLVDGARLATEMPGDEGATADHACAPIFVLVEGGGETVEGQIIKGVRDEDGAWDLDGVFTIQTDEGELLKVHGWNCITEAL